MSTMSKKQISHLSLIFFIILIFCQCTVLDQSFGRISSKENIQKEEIYVIKNVNIIPMTMESKIISNATVIIKNKKIFSINQPVPDKAKIINGKGKWLIPGLIDMHVHNLADINLSSSYPTKGATIFTDTQDFMLLYVVNGVTTAFELNARVEHFGQRNEILKGNLYGPRMALAMLIDGGEGSGNKANTAADGRQTVRMAKAQGYEFVKVYAHLNVETYKAIVDEASKQGMKVVGHIPDVFKGHIDDAFVPNFAMVAHAEEYAKQSEDFTDQDAQYYAKITKANGTWFTPTLTTMEWILSQSRSLEGVRNLSSLKYVHPLIQSRWLYSNSYNQESTTGRIRYFEKMVEFNMRLVKAFKEAGVPIVAGTDAGNPGVVWGFSLHDEIELLVKAGLSPEEALVSATRLPAIWLGIEDKIGTVEVGKYADLVLLDANPLQDIRNTRKIAGVFLNGKWIDKKIMDSMLSAVAERNTANKNKYDWKKRMNFE
ncbi:imidazolonepropionase-like amidohydrolase [Pedobacter alluvionis]|uniref:Imidazolonepropionase-like amidohydrolase n=3 Tax=Pedobacter alluvionis TaxID=475253 RepID=A0A497Y8H1_9SPHI|nr:imidazolonepropionase-like amidohydrolase [Pedobacter alluvionis]